MATKKDEKTVSKKINETGTAEARGKANAPGQSKLHTFTRQNPVTMVRERAQFPQSEHKERMSEGWVRLEDVTGDQEGEVDNPVVDTPAGPVQGQA